MIQSIVRKDDDGDEISALLLLLGCDRSRSALASSTTLSWLDKSKAKQFSIGTPLPAKLSTRRAVVNTVQPWFEKQSTSVRSKPRLPAVIKTVLPTAAVDAILCCILEMQCCGRPCFLVHFRMRRYCPRSTVLWQCPINVEVRYYCTTRTNRLVAERRIVSLAI